MCHVLFVGHDILYLSYYGSIGAVGFRNAFQSRLPPHEAGYNLTGMMRGVQKRRPLSSVGSGQVD